MKAKRGGSRRAAGTRAWRQVEGKGGSEISQRQAQKRNDYVIAAGRAQPTTAALKTKKKLLVRCIIPGARSLVERIEVRGPPKYPPC